MSDVDLTTIRGDIDAIDRQLVALLDERARLALAAGAMKDANGAELRAPAREDEVLARAREHARGEMPAVVVEDIMRVVVGACLRLQARPKVACLGPLGTFSTVAARARFGTTATIVTTATIAAAVAMVAKGEVDHAVVPVEGTAAGRVDETLFAVSSQAARVRVTSEFPVAVDYRLLGAGGLAEVTEVWSRPEALRACAKWLGKAVPNAKLVETVSTAAAAHAVAESGRNDIAAIGSTMAAELYGLATVARVDDGRHAVTRFWLVGAVGP